jgi:hypothetical protein
MTKAVHEMNMVKRQVNPETFHKTARERVHSEIPAGVTIRTVSRAVAAAVDEHQMVIRRNHVVRIAKVVRIAQHAGRRDLKAVAANDNQHVAVAAGGN